MRLELKNVCKINKADIELNGITIIAGINNTGKSTVGEMLFCIFSSFYKIEEQVRKDRQKSINRVLLSTYQERTNKVKGGYEFFDFANTIVTKRDEYCNNHFALCNDIKDFYIKYDEQNEDKITDEMCETVAEKINESLTYSDMGIINYLLRKRLTDELGMKIGNLNYPDEPAEICLSIKDKHIKFNITNNDFIHIEEYISLFKRIIYIDDPFVIDDLDGKSYYQFMMKDDHKSDLLLKITSKEKFNDFSALDELLANSKFERIINEMNKVCDGDLVSSDEFGSYTYKSTKLNGTLNISNISTGLKTFVIIRTLLRKGYIDDNGIIILDEPEIHLHPEWQLRFAEIIVLIQREFGTNILLNTHSPYFLNAIETFSKKYGVNDKCKFYLTQEVDDRTNLVDVSQCTDKIYELLARPLQELENLEHTYE